MSRDFIRLVLLTSLIAVTTICTAAGPEPELLWPGGAPHATGTDEADTPTIRAYIPKKNATGAGVVICPGGGYGILAMDHEGHQVAKWLNTIGVAGFVVRYRHAPKYRHPVPMEDAQRAVRFVRANSKRYGVDNKRIGILGFSAGGHLASTVATHFDIGNKNAEDSIDRQSCRPDFAVLCYPVISLVDDFAHKGSGRNLFGPDATKAQLTSLSNHNNVTADTPPTFLFHTAEDRGVPVENSLAFFAACRKAGVPAELHVYQDGPHGVGLSPADPATYGWKDRLASWMQSNGLLGVTKRVESTGSVSINGEPLRWGMIAFVPKDQNLPRAWTMVSRGKYRIPAERGTAVGLNTVLIYNLGSVEPRPTIEDFTVTDGSLAVQVSKDGPNNFDFDLDQ